MLYLLLPDLTMKWSDLPRSAVKDAQASNVDLGDLPWEPSERRATIAHLRWALRHGVPCAAGLVLYAPDLSVVDTPAEMRNANTRVNESLARLDMADHSAAINTSATEALEEAEEERREALAAPPKEDAVSRWKALGGVLPAPL